MPRLSLTGTGPGALVPHVLTSTSLLPPREDSQFHPGRRLLLLGDLWPQWDGGAVLQHLHIHPDPLVLPDPHRHHPCPLHPHPHYHSHHHHPDPQHR